MPFISQYSLGRTAARTGGTSNMACQPAIMIPTASPLFVHTSEPESPFALNSYRLPEFSSAKVQYSFRAGFPPDLSTTCTPAIIPKVTLLDAPLFFTYISYLSFPMEVASLSHYSYARYPLWGRASRIM